jgi:hypothetical protein
MSQQEDKIRQIIEQKRKRDPEGFQKAEINGSLQTFLANDFKKAGIDPNLISDYLKATSELDKYLFALSDGLDEIIFEPFYQSQKAVNHMYITEALTACKSSKYIEYRLKLVKVLSAGGSLICAGLSLSNLGNIFKLVIFGVLSVDLLRISYNCYMKNYVSLALKKIGGDPAKVAKSIFKFAQNVIGINASNSDDDPFFKLKNDVMIDVVFENTLMKQGFEKVFF